MTGTGRLRAWGPRVVALAGLVVMLAVGVRAGRYTYFLDPELPCLRRGLCDDDANAAALRSLWFPLALGGVAVVLGLLATLARRPGGSRPRLGPADIVVAPGLSVAVCAVAAPVMLGAAFAGGIHLGVAAGAVVSVGLAWLLDRTVPKSDPATNSRARGGLALLLVAVGMLALLGTAGSLLRWGPSSLDLPLVLGAALLAQGVTVAGVVAAAGASQPATHARRDASSSSTPMTRATRSTSTSQDSRAAPRRCATAAIMQSTIPRGVTPAWRHRR